MITLVGSVSTYHRYPAVRAPFLVLLMLLWYSGATPADSKDQTWLLGQQFGRPDRWMHEHKLDWKPRGRFVQWCFWTHRLALRDSSCKIIPPPTLLQSWGTLLYDYEQSTRTSLEHATNSTSNLEDPSERFSIRSSQSRLRVRCGAKSALHLN